MQCCKPVIDRLLAGILLLVFLPGLLICMLSVRLTSGPNVIYRQARVGKDGRVFTMYKLRTMLPDRRRWQMPYEGPDRRGTHKSDDDPRMTSVGRFLRRSSFDELPQLWNVLRGDMSLVGPRPELVHIVEREQMWLHPRHWVQPGLTGLWQISEHRNEAMYRHLEFDLNYIGTCGFATDVRILARTMVAMVRRIGC